MAEWQKWQKWREWQNGLQKYLHGNSIGTTNVAEWQKEWSNGRMVEWRDGYLPTTFMVHADDNDDDDNDDDDDDDDDDDRLRHGHGEVSTTTMRWGRG